MRTAVPDWFNDAIVDGLQGLYSLCLQGAPAAEVMEATTGVWITVLWDASNTAWDEVLDPPRIAAAFHKLALTSERWPAIPMLRRAMPPRPEPLALPEPDSKGPPGHVKARLLRSIQDLAAKMSRTPWSN